MRPDDTKLRELILYIALKCMDAPRFGRVKLNKILCYADFEAYVTLGQPITGQRYVKMPNGPVAPRVREMLSEMEQAGEAVIHRRTLSKVTEERPVPTRAPHLTCFSPEELAVVDRFIQRFWNKTGTTTSNISHDEMIGWRAVKPGEEIPYETAFLSDQPLTEAQIRFGQALARSGR